MNQDPEAGGLSSHHFAVEMLEEAPCGIAATHPDGTIITANRTFARWVDRSMADLTGTIRLQDLMTLPGRMFFETHVSPMLRLQGFVREIACQLRRPDAEPLPVLLNAALRSDADGRAVRIDYMLFDSTERRLYEQSLRDARQEAEQLAAIVTSSPDAILRIESDGTVLRWNQGAERLLNISSAEAIHGDVERLIPLADRPGWFRRATADVAATGAQRFESRLPSGPHVEVTVSPIREPFARPEVAAFSVVLRDVSETVAANERTRLIMGELNHRVKNILGVVIGIARQTLPERGDDATERFVSRLHALSRAHDILIAGDWSDTRLHDLMELAAEEAGGEARLHHDVPPIMLSAKQAVAFSMALHELVTNSLKYGSLSRKEGSVEVVGRLESDRLHLTWEETGGPRVEKPLRKGFGTTMVERALAAELGGNVSMLFRPEGLVCRIEARWPGRCRGPVPSAPEPPGEDRPVGPSARDRL